MGPGFPCMTRRQHLALKAIALPFELLEFVLVRRNRRSIGLALVFLAIAWSAFGMAGPMGERRAGVCERLGYPDLECDLLYEPDTRFTATLELVVDDEVSEADQPPLFRYVSATSLTIRPAGGPTIGQVYQINSGKGHYPEEQGWAWLNFILGTMHAPCVFSECVAPRQAAGQWGSYTGVTEEHLTDITNMVSHLFYQAPDIDFTAAIQSARGAVGLPFVTYASPELGEVDDHSGSYDDLATTFRIPVVIRFACAYPGEGCVP